MALSSQALWEQPSDLAPSADEIRERLENIEKWESHWRKEFEKWTLLKPSNYKPFSDLQIAALMTIPIKRLQYKRSTFSAEDTFLGKLFRFPNFAKEFFTHQPARGEERYQFEQVSPKRKREKSPEGDVSRAKRARVNQDAKEDVATMPMGDHNPQAAFEISVVGDTTAEDEEKKRQLRLDAERCVILGTNEPVIHHIVPTQISPTGLKGDHAGRLLYDGIRFAGHAAHDSVDTPDPEEYKDLFSHGAHVFDKSWNMISLHRTIREWWTKAYFGLECLGIVPQEEGQPEGIATIKLQFQWMPWRERSEEPLKRTVGSISAIFGRTYGDLIPGNPVLEAAAQLPPRTQLPKTGNLYYINVEREHAQKMVRAFNLQWTLAMIVAMAGGAKVLEAVPDKPDFIRLGFFTFWPGVSPVPWPPLKSVWDSEDSEGEDSGDDSKDDSEDSSEDDSGDDSEDSDEEGLQ
ncbi:hypothetical protein OQA88_3719 [Cercophora sp. LCS_1]